jgi:hypothetical protein
MKKKVDESDTVQSNAAKKPEQEELDVLQSCAISQNLTAGILVVSDPINSLVHKYLAQRFPGNYV